MKLTETKEDMSAFAQAVNPATPAGPRASSPACLHDHAGNILTSQLYRLHGMRAIDINGEVVGSIGWIWENTATGGGDVIGVGLHWLRGTVRAIPANGARFDSRTSTVRLAYTKDQITSAPRFKIDRVLTTVQKRTISAHYDLATASAPARHVTRRLAA